MTVKKHKVGQVRNAHISEIVLDHIALGKRELLVHLYIYLECLTFLSFSFPLGGWLWVVIVVLYGLFI